MNEDIAIQLEQELQGKNPFEVLGISPYYVRVFSGDDEVLKDLIRKNWRNLMSTINFDRNPSLGRVASQINAAYDFLSTDRGFRIAKRDYSNPGRDIERQKIKAQTAIAQRENLERRLNDLEAKSQKIADEARRSALAEGKRKTEEFVTDYMDLFESLQVAFLGTSPNISELRDIFDEEEVAPLILPGTRWLEDPESYPISRRHFFRRLDRDKRKYEPHEGTIPKGDYDIDISRIAGHPAKDLYTVDGYHLLLKKFGDRSVAEGSVIIGSLPRRSIPEGQLRRGESYKKCISFGESNLLKKVYPVIAEKGILVVYNPKSNDPRWGQKPVALGEVKGIRALL